VSVHPRLTGPVLLTCAAPLVGIAMLILAPGTLDDKLRFVLSGLGAQRIGHSLVVEGRPLPIETRMLGIYVGFTVTVAAAWLGGGARRVRLPSGGIGALLMLGVGLMVADGLNAWMYGRGESALYEPQAGLRLATGLLCGLGVASAIAPVVSSSFWQHRELRPLFASGLELFRTLLVLAVVGLVFWAGVGGPTVLGMLALIGVFAGFWLVSTCLVVGAWVGLARAEHWTDLAGLATVGFVLATVELLGLAALRAWLEQSVGVVFPV